MDRHTIRRLGLDGLELPDVPAIPQKAPHARLSALTLLTLAITVGPAFLNAQCQVMNTDVVVAADHANTYQSHYMRADSFPLIEAFQPSYFRIGRVVGPGVSSEFDNTIAGVTGPILLANWSTYVANGVVGSTAWVEVAATIIPGFVPSVNGPVTVKGSLQFELNGTAISAPKAFTYTGENNTPASFTLLASTCLPLDKSNAIPPVDARLLHFARQLNDSSGAACPITVLAGEQTCPGVNEIEAHLRAEVVCPGAALGVNCPLVSVGFAASATKLIFRAMAPIVLIHGWNSGPWQWGPETPDPNGVCGAGQIPSDQGRTFINRFVAAKVPFYCKWQVDRQALIEKGAQAMLADIPTIAAKYGTKFVHLVAISKGGLFTRAFLDDNARVDPSQQIGIISATTLDTPHQGSILADFVVLYNQGVRTGVPFALKLGHLFARILTPTEIKNAFGAGNSDMTTAKASAFNEIHTAPPPGNRLQVQNQILTITKPGYFSTSANADLNLNEQLEDNEAAPYFSLQARFSWKLIGRVTTVLLGQSQGKTVAVPVETVLFRDNDTAVSLFSARVTGFEEIGVYRANHATILCPGIGLVLSSCPPFPSPVDDVLARIRLAEKQVNVQIQ